jgi:hypothetical protein
MDLLTNNRVLNPDPDIRPTAADLGNQLRAILKSDKAELSESGCLSVDNIPV